MPPTSGAIQNNQSCVSAAPPTISAGPVERAGLTDVLVRRRRGWLIDKASDRRQERFLGWRGVRQIARVTTIFFRRC